MRAIDSPWKIIRHFEEVKELEISRLFKSGEKVPTDIQNNECWTISQEQTPTQVQVGEGFLHLGVSRGH